MRTRVMVVSREGEVRAHLAQLGRRAGYRVDVAESLAHARRGDPEGVALALLSSDILEEEPGALEELRSIVSRVLIVGSGDRGRRPGHIDISNERGLLDRITEALANDPATEFVEPTLEFGSYRLDLAGHSLTDQAGHEIALSHGEFALLQVFALRPGRVLSRDQLLQLTAGRDADAYDRSVDMQIARLRRKIEPDPKRPSLILTVPNSGYKFAATVRKAKPASTAKPDAGEGVSDEARCGPERRYVTAISVELVPDKDGGLPSDPEDLRIVISAFRHFAALVLNQFGGTIGGSHGREITAYFGFPMGQEDAAERALHAAIGLVGRSTRGDASIPPGFAIRVGITSGPVIATPEGELVGETVDEAGRLREAAEPGQALVTAGTRRQTGELFTYSYLGKIFPNAGGGPLQVWEVVGPSALSSHSEALFVGRLTPLVGREEELDLLLRAWRQAKSGDGRLVLLSGEPGIGKSRLLAALEEALADEPHVSWRYFCSALHQDSALHPIIARWEQEAGFAPGDPGEARLRKLEALLAPENIPAEDVALVAAMLSVPADERYPRLELTPQQRKQRTFAALQGRLTRVARQAPLLILAEDAHWADPSSIEMFHGVVDRMQELPILLIVSYRPEFAAPWVGRAGTSLIALGRLNPRQSASLAAEVSAKRPLSQELQARIIAQADGVPLFIEELTKAVLETSAASHSSMSPLAIPSTLHATLMARLDRLPIAKRVAQIGAVIGREFPQTLITAAASMSQAEMSQGLDELVASGLAARRGATTDAVYSFKHALVQDAVYGTLLREPRRALHAEIAEALESQFPSIAESEPEVLARHCAEAGLIEKAARLWGAAGRRSLARSAPLEAVNHLKRALGIIESLPGTPALRREEISLQTTLMTTLYLVKGYAALEAKAALERARFLFARAESLGEPNENPLALFAILAGL